jgi:hypothetical protein
MRQENMIDTTQCAQGKIGGTSSRVNQHILVYQHRRGAKGPSTNAATAAKHP